MSIDRAPTYGETAVGLTFNPAGDPAVHAIKSGFAAIIDHLQGIREATTNPEVKRLCSVAITESQGAQMWAVKALTWRG